MGLSGQERKKKKISRRCPALPAKERPPLSMRSFIVRITVFTLFNVCNICIFHPSDRALLIGRAPHSGLRQKSKKSHFPHSWCHLKNVFAILLFSTLLFQNCPKSYFFYFRGGSSVIVADFCSCGMLKLRLSSCRMDSLESKGRQTIDSTVRISK